jgi:uncharacterized protein
MACWRKYSFGADGAACSCSKHGNRRAQDVVWIMEDAAAVAEDSRGPTVEGKGCPVRGDDTELDLQPTSEPHPPLDQRSPCLSAYQPGPWVEGQDPADFSDVPTGVGGQQHQVHVACHARPSVRVRTYERQTPDVRLTKHPSCYGLHGSEGLTSPALQPRGHVLHTATLVQPARGPKPVGGRPDNKAPALRAGGMPWLCPMTPREIPRPASDCWLDPRVTVRESSIQGDGLFATEPIEHGELVSRLGGRLVSTHDLHHLFAQSHRYVDTITVAKDLHLVLPPRQASGHGNHSCDPNLWWDGYYHLVAKRNITQGEELTTDYASSTTDESWSMTCTCGATSCRRIITGADYRTTNLVQRYQNHVVPAVLEAASSNS